jgi:hypothetical protein
MLFATSRAAFSGAHQKQSFTCRPATHVSLTGGQTKRRSDSAEAPILVGSFPVGHSTVTFTFRGPVKGEVHYSLVEWEPDAPKPRELSPNLLQDYRDGCLPEFVGPARSRRSESSSLFHASPSIWPTRTRSKASAGIYEGRPSRP